jgi:hypothetical protein
MCILLYFELNAGIDKLGERLCREHALKLWGEVVSKIQRRYLKYAEALSFTLIRRNSVPFTKFIT